MRNLLVCNFLLTYAGLLNLAYYGVESFCSVSLSDPEVVDVQNNSPLYKILQPLQVLIGTDKW